MSSVAQGVITHSASIYIEYMSRLRYRIDPFIFDRLIRTVQNQIRMLLEEQSDRVFTVEQPVFIFFLLGLIWYVVKFIYVVFFFFLCIEFGDNSSGAPDGRGCRG